MHDPHLDFVEHDHGLVSRQDSHSFEYLKVARELPRATPPGVRDIDSTFLPHDIAAEAQREMIVKASRPTSAVATAIADE